MSSVAPPLDLAPTPQHTATRTAAPSLWRDTVRNVLRQRSAVVGLARSGVAAARFAASRGAHVTVNDSKPLDRLGPEAVALATEGVRVEAGGHPEDLFRSADLVIVSPGVPADAPALAVAREAGVQVISEVELASRHLRGRIVGITGTNGKTTTTTLTHEVLRDGGLMTTVAGNIGTPLVSLVAESTDDTWHVVELSSF